MGKDLRELAAGCIIELTTTGRLSPPRAYAPKRLALVFL